MSVLKPEEKLVVISVLTKDCSIRSAPRMTGVHKKTIMKLLVEVGSRYEQMMDEKMRGLHLKPSNVMKYRPLYRRRKASWNRKSARPVLSWATGTPALRLIWSAR